MTNFYSDDDFKFIKNFVGEQSLRKIYITGYLQVGKSTFCNRFIKEVYDCRYLDLDKMRAAAPGVTRNEVLRTAINENENNFYILEHWQLLDDDDQQTLQVWENEADILIMLNPKNTDTEVENRDYQEKFERLAGKMIYNNQGTGTQVKLMNVVHAGESQQ